MKSIMATVLKIDDVCSNFEAFSQNTNEKLSDSVEKIVFEETDLLPQTCGKYKQSMFHMKKPMTFDMTNTVTKLRNLGRVSKFFRWKIIEKCQPTTKFGV